MDVYGDQLREFDTTTTISTSIATTGIAITVQWQWQQRVTGANDPYGAGGGGEGGRWAVELL